MEGLIRYQSFTGMYSSKRWWTAALVLVYATIFIGGLSRYLQWQSATLVLGIVSLFFCTHLDRQRRGSRRFGYVAYAFLVLLIIIPVKTMLYLAIITGVFYLVESFFGRINTLPLLSVLVMSPFFQYVSSVFVFPIRIQLSQWAGALLQLSGSKAQVAGNVITLHGQEFSVDPACMGLNMLVVSLLLSIMLMGHYQHRRKRYLHTSWVVIILALTFLLNILSNLLRILVLVQFSLLPGDAMHDVAGLVSLLVYVFVPSALLVKWMVKHFGKARQPVEKTRKALVMPHAVLAALHVLLTFQVLSAAPQPVMHVTAAFERSGYRTTMLDNEVLKLENNVALIYIKPIPHFYNADHNPMICWKGSGYEMKKINTATIAGMQVYTGMLQKENETLYTSWWYAGGGHHTISQLDWRWRMLKEDKRFAVVNVTAATQEEMEAQILLISRQSLIATL